MATQARRVLGRWLIAAWLERGVDPARGDGDAERTRAHLTGQRRVERVLGRRELAELLGTPPRLRVFPSWAVRPLAVRE